MPSSASTDKAAFAGTPPVPSQGPPVYTPPAGQQTGYAQPPEGYAPQQQGFAQPQQQGFPQPQQQQGFTPQQPGAGYAPQPPLQGGQSAAQIGEQYRAQLFAQCAQGIHQPTTKYGVCGIITAVVCFPIGLICLFNDSEQRCDRCGIKLS